MCLTSTFLSILALRWKSHRTLDTCGGKNVEEKRWSQSNCLGSRSLCTPRKKFRVHHIFNISVHFPWDFHLRKFLGTWIKFPGENIAFRKLWILQKMDSVVDQCYGTANSMTNMKQYVGKYLPRWRFMGDRDMFVRHWCIYIPYFFVIFRLRDVYIPHFWSLWSKIMFRVYIHIILLVTFRFSSRIDVCWGSSLLFRLQCN